MLLKKKVNQVIYLKVVQDKRYRRTVSNMVLFSVLPGCRKEWVTLERGQTSCGILPSPARSCPRGRGGSHPPLRRQDAPGQEKPAWQLPPGRPSPRGGRRPTPPSGGQVPGHTPRPRRCSGLLPPGGAPKPRDAVSNQAAELMPGQATGTARMSLVVKEI